MTDFVDLWSRSLSLESVEAAQRYVHVHLQEACLQKGFAFWKSSEPPPAPAISLLFLGIAPYDRNDLALLDSLLEKDWSRSGQYAEVVVFSLADAFSLGDIRRVVPDVDSFGGCNPFVAAWREGRCFFSAAGYSARKWVEALPAGG